MSGSNHTPDAQQDTGALALLTEFSEDLQAKLSRLLVISGLVAILVAINQPDKAIKLLDADIPGFTVNTAIGAGFWINVHTLASIGIFHFMRGAKTTRVLFLQDARDLIRKKSAGAPSPGSVLPNQDASVANPSWLGLAEERVNQESTRAERVFKYFHYYMPIILGLVACLYSAEQGLYLLLSLLSEPIETLRYCFIWIFSRPLGASL